MRRFYPTIYEVPILYHPVQSQPNGNKQVQDHPDGSKVGLSLANESPLKSAATFHRG